MPRLDKAERRDRIREKKKKMVVSGRGLITDAPNEERRKEKRWKKKYNDVPTL